MPVSSLPHGATWSTWSSLEPTLTLRSLCGVCQDTSLSGCLLPQLAMSGMAAPSEGSFGEGGEQGPCMSVRESGHSGGGLHPHMEGQESHRRTYTDDAQVRV